MEQFKLLVEEIVRPRAGADNGAKQKFGRKETNNRSNLDQMLRQKVTNTLALCLREANSFGNEVMLVSTSNF